MFSEGRIGKYIKTWAKVHFVTNTIFSMVLFFVCLGAFLDSMGGIGFLIALLIALASFSVNLTISVFLYAFGTIVDCTVRQENSLKQLNRKAAPAPSVTDALPPM